MGIKLYQNPFLDGMHMDWTEHNSGNSNRMQQGYFNSHEGLLSPYILGKLDQTLFCIHKCMIMHLTKAKWLPFSTQVAYSNICLILLVFFYFPTYNTFPKAFRFTRVLNYFIFSLVYFHSIFSSCNNLLVTLYDF